MGQFPVHQYLNVQQAYASCFRSDGEQLGFLADITGIAQVWQVPARAGDVPLWPTQMTFGDDRVMGFRFSPLEDDRRLIFARDVGGNENAQLFLMAEGEPERRLTEGHDDVMHTFGAWSTDGQRILFSSNLRDRSLFDLYCQALDGEAECVWQNDQYGFLGEMRFSPDGRRAVAAVRTSSMAHALYEIDLHTRQARALHVEGYVARYENVWYAADGRSLYLRTNVDADFLYVAKLGLGTGAIEPMVQLDHDVEWLVLSPDGTQLAFSVNDRGFSSVRLLDLASSEVRTLADPAEGRGMIGPAVFSPDGKYLALAVTRATRTADVYLTEIAVGVSTPMTQVSHGGIPTDTFVDAELIAYPTFDGREIPAWIYRPTEIASPCPAVAIVHGGPEGQSRINYQGFVQCLVHHGYVVFVPNVRGSTGYGRAYADLDNVRHRMDSVADLEYGAAWLAEQSEVDGNRLAIYGGSYGGFMVLSSLATYPDRWAAAVDLVGISNFVTFLENTSGYRRAHREAEYGSLERDRDFLAEISPMTHVDQMRTPLMVIHGRNDPRVPLSETEQLVDALQTRGVPVEFMVFEDEGHGIAKRKNRTVAYDAIVRFLERYLSI